MTSRGRGAPCRDAERLSSLTFWLPDGKNGGGCEAHHRQPFAFFWTHVRAGASWVGWFTAAVPTCIYEPLLRRQSG